METDHGWNNVNQEGQQYQGGEKDGKAKAIDLAKKGWAMYKDHKGQQ
jgi:hypothetical protein